TPRRRPRKLSWNKAAAPWRRVASRAPRRAAAPLRRSPPAAPDPEPRIRTPRSSGAPRPATQTKLAALPAGAPRPLRSPQFIPGRPAFAAPEHGRNVLTQTNRAAALSAALLPRRTPTYESDAGSGRVVPQPRGSAREFCACHYFCESRGRRFAAPRGRGAPLTAVRRRGTLLSGRR